MVREEDFENDDDSLGVDLDLIGILKRRFHLIVLGVLIGATLAAGYYVQQVPIYQSGLTVLVGQNGSKLAAQGSSGIIEGSTSVQSSILATHVELFRSPKVIRGAVEDGGLPRSPGKIAQSLIVSRGGEGPSEGASLLKASYSDTDPEVAAKVLGAVYESYHKYIDEQSRSVGQEAAQLIEEAQVENEQAVREADEAYRQFMANVPALVGGGEGGLQDVHRMRLQTIEGDLAAVRKEIATAKARYSGIRQVLTSRDREELTDAEVITLLSPDEVSRMQAIIGLAHSDREISLTGRLASSKAGLSVNLEYQQLLRLTSELRVLEAQFGKAHPSVAAMQQKINGVRQAIQETRNEQPEKQKSVKIRPVDILANYVQLLESDINELTKREAELVELSKEESAAAKEVEINFMEGNSLKGNLERARQRYDEVFARLQEINLTNDYSGFSTDLLTTPTPASVPVAPSKSRIASIGILMGGMIGLGLAMLAEFTDRTFKTPGDVEAAVGAPILAHIPFLNFRTLQRKTIPDTKIAANVVTFHQPGSSEAETFRVLRTSLLGSVKKGGKQAFLITSPGPVDGKSTTVANLAVSVAGTGKRVLLLDADLRRPMVHEIMGVDRSPGLSDYIGGHADFDDCVYASDQQGLTVCPCGSRTCEPAELLESDAFARFMRRARERYDMIFVDVPPILAVTDPSIVAGYVDGCLLAVRIEKKNRTIVERAAQAMRTHGIGIDGIIVNSRNSKRRHYAYSGYNFYGKYANGYQARYRRYYESSGDDESTRRSTRRDNHGSRCGTAPVNSPAHGTVGTSAVDC